MRVLLDLDAEVPIYQQIRDQVVEAIAAGTLAPGAGLPSTRQLAVDLAVNFHTVNKAYDLLRREGIIRVNRKSGAAVRPDVKQSSDELRVGVDWEARMHTLLAELDVRGISKEEVMAYVEATLDGFPGRGDGGSHR
ncbi:GntR family transcriptional regulator [Streptomyces sp. NL15-2K]|uniref:GntR family transcriptional regulator n=1 Tax=Streptomyces sp. NL15-2K TaxID=376149 RepID=UPI000F55EC43|nr:MULTISPECIES: GntR family transcriptional regulator [Actinomycetes]WKX14145.1 GntR family transcriptional regulator [Kutzneria buriramensis]GCB44698.1 gntR family transcriptional regulator [Streptomyces sp. NL15-2K]